MAKRKSRSSKSKAKAGSGQYPRSAGGPLAQQRRAVELAAAARRKDLIDKIRKRRAKQRTAQQWNEERAARRIGEVVEKARKPRTTGGLGGTPPISRVQHSVSNRSPSTPSVNPRSKERGNFSRFDPCHSRPDSRKAGRARMQTRPSAGSGTTARQYKKWC